MSHATVIADGQRDWSGGVDSLAVTTIASQTNPHGLRRDQLAWGINLTVRDGGISPRAAFRYLSGIVNGGGLFQGCFLYEPLVGDPYLIVCISGHVLQVLTSAPFTVTDLSVAFPTMTMPATETYFYFVQAEEYLVIQAGDLITLPLFWNGAVLRRSIGITNTAVAPGTPNVNEIPASGSMTYFMQRLWYAQGRNINAGDIVGGNSGTGTPGNRGAVLNVTENPLVVGGDGFTVPTQSGNIRVLTFNANINATLGQGQLLAGTRKTITSLIAPVTRTDWIAATTNNQPEQLVIQLVNGPVNDRSVTKINGDLYFVSLEPAVRSLFASVRNWSQPGNISISAQIQRLLQFNDRSVLRFTSGVFWDNRLLMTQLPVQASQGVICEASAVLDFLPMSTLGGQLQPIWEGVREGPQVLQYVSGDFGGLERAFAIVVSQLDGAIELWELSTAGRFDLNRTNEKRITWIAEFPAFTWGQEDVLKKLTTMELGLDRVFGEVVIKVEYRQDQQTCWLPWTTFKICSARNSEEEFSTPTHVEPNIYPLPTFGDCYRSCLTMPEPPAVCSPCGNKLPSNIAYQFQPRITITGSCRIRRMVLWAEVRELELFKNIVCPENLCVPLPAGFVPEPIVAPPELNDMASTCCSGSEPFDVYSQTLSATNGTPPFVYTIESGALPSGFTLTQDNPLTALVTGTCNPDLPATTFTILITDANGVTSSRSYTICFPSVNNPDPGIQNQAYSYQFVVNNGCTGSYTFEVVVGGIDPAFAAGLTLTASGLLSGTPTQFGSFQPNMLITGPDGVACLTMPLLNINHPD